MKIGDQMLYLAQLKGLSKREALARIQDWCQRLDITSWLDKKIEDLSKRYAAESTICRHGHPPTTIDYLG
ncbi:ABC-type uncharacterized transport system, ATPase component [Sphingobacterium multivorum]|uniref:ABC-type uncharacterized transport system, ATPase component n=1 Tax=Sphingobacterium multivorum TaxID=28454 RepID=A0A2X2J102_SPHMU|nr:hypothetical protein [Sphingobacterium multivorum]SPZ85326.1 ABC-type uncharacterized transport system, ATPase component [Sphingobacterium multivorum]